MVGVQDRFVADRIPVDITGLRDDINSAFQEETFWNDLSMSQKIRKIIEIGLTQIKSQQETNTSEPSSKDSA